MSITDTRPDPGAEKAGKSSRRWGVPIAIAATVFFALLSPLWAPLLMRRMDFFRVRHVEVVGARYAEPRDILKRMRVDTLASVWDPPRPWEARIADHPLVRSVEVDRRLPGTLVVRVVEHVPVALVSTPRGFRPYDERGVALQIDPTTAAVDVPILSRPDTAMLRLLSAMRSREPRLYDRLSEVRRGGPGAPEIMFILDSLPVRAPADVSLNRLADLKLVEQDLMRRRLRPIELDLRYRDQVIARLQ